ncbi:MAG: peptidyl-tRNA hydrolase, family [Patescibacteria group bacterium]|nr:peptidyl-tRNA hydrolase, family [Patescibacteria group bacterium]
MKLIIGLGNPGNKYKFSRHNAGFLALDKIKEKYGFPDFKLNKDFKAEISEENIRGNKILLAKPQTFMNNSGEATRKIADFYKIAPDNIVVIHDDLDIELGNCKIATDSRSAGHNGVQNIIDILGTQKFKRIRIGIGKFPAEKAACPISGHPPRVEERPSPRVEAGDYVLGNFTEEELKKIEKVFENVLEEIKDFL